jgi:hypothetical protein
MGEKAAVDLPFRRCADELKLIRMTSWTVLPCRVTNAITVPIAMPFIAVPVAIDVAVNPVQATLIYEMVRHYGVYLNTATTPHGRNWGG